MNNKPTEITTNWPTVSIICLSFLLLVSLLPILDFRFYKQFIKENNKQACCFLSPEAKVTEIREEINGAFMCLCVYVCLCFNDTS